MTSYEYYQYLRAKWMVNGYLTAQEVNAFNAFNKPKHLDITEIKVNKEK